MPQIPDTEGQMGLPLDLIGRWADQTLGLTPMRPARAPPVREVPPISPEVWNRILRTWPSATAQED